MTFAALLFMAATMPPAFPVESVVRGQHGQCLTVFEGDTVEPFDFVVKGVMKQFLGPGRDVVLVKLLGDKPNFTGVVAGMSGSPCSIDGKLLGALAYSFAMFAKEPIAGITPIGSMIDVLRLPAESRPWRQARNDDWPALARGEAVAALPDAGTLRPIATPLSMGGVTPEVQRHFEPFLRSLGFEPIAAGATTGGAAPTRLVPGGSVAAILIRGDADVAATGTVTWVEGNEFLAFGHPFVGAGAVSLPVAGADILNTMSSAMRSFKMAATGPPLGEVTQDRLTAIGGMMGGVPKMVPVHGTVVTPHGTDTFELELARDVYLTPRLLAMGLSSALTGRVEVGERGTVRLSGEVRVADLPPVPLDGVYAAERDGGLLMYAALDTAKTFGALWDTPFGPPPATAQVQIKAVLEPEPIIETVQEVLIDRSRLRPGEAVQVVARLRREGGAPVVERFVVRVPRAWAGSEIDIVVSGADGAERVARDVGGQPKPVVYDQIARHLRRRRVDGQLYLQAVRRGAGLHAPVDDLPFLPPSVVATWTGEPTVESRSEGVAWEERRSRPGVVGGMARTRLQILQY